MKYISVSYNNHRNLFNLILLGISISFTLGLLISLCLEINVVDEIYELFLNNINSYNSNMLSNILYSIIVYLGIFILSLTIIGCFMPFFSVFIENISIGLILGVLLRKCALKGLLYGMIYFAMTKLVYLIILVYLSFNIYKFVCVLINALKNKNSDSIYSLYSNILLKLLFCIVGVTVVNLLNIFIVPYILELFIFLL